MRLPKSLRRKGSSAENPESPGALAEALQRDFRGAPIRTDPRGHFYGPLAQGLALAAPMAHAFDGAWNSLTDVGVIQVRAALKLWDISDAASWQAVLHGLVNSEPEHEREAVYRAVAVRTEVKRARELPLLDDAAWAAALRDEASRLDADEQYAEALCTAIGPIRAAEDILRAAHLLGGDEEVQALNGDEYEWAVCLARCGVALGYGDPQVTAQVALACRNSAALRYSSWRDYALGSYAGTLVAYPDERQHPVSAIEEVRPFLDSVNSPWTHLPFPTEPVPIDDQDGAGH